MPYEKMNKINIAFHAILFEKLKQSLETKRNMNVTKYDLKNILGEMEKFYSRPHLNSKLSAYSQF